MAAWREAGAAIVARSGGGERCMGVGGVLLTECLLFTSKLAGGTTNPPFLHVGVGADLRVDRVSLDHLREG